MSDFGDGVFWIGLAPVRDPDWSSTRSRRRLAKQEPPRHISDKQLSPVLDNLEHVVESAVTWPRCRDCPNLRFLITSRELSRVDGEVIYPAPARRAGGGRAVPRAGAHRARRGRAELCGRLDNLPLALELAAARVSVLTTAQIVERISQRLDLFTAGRDADLANRRCGDDRLAVRPAQRTSSGFFARMAVFLGGGCTLEAPRR